MQEVNDKPNDFKGPATPNIGEPTGADAALNAAFEIAGLSELKALLDDLEVRLADLDKQRAAIFADYEKKKADLLRQKGWI
jgi:hypothetical protein